MKKRAGFTLFELMIAIAVIAILSTIGIPAYQGYIQKAALTDMLQLTASYRTAIELCLFEHGNHHNCNMGSNNIMPTTSSRYVKEVNVDQGKITITGQNSLSGLTVILVPQFNTNTGNIIWQRNCNINNNTTLYEACNTVFRFADQD